MHTYQPSYSISISQSFIFLSIYQLVYYPINNSPSSQNTPQTKFITTNNPTRQLALHPLHILSVIHRVLTTSRSIIHLRSIPRIHMSIPHSRIHSFRPSTSLIIHIMSHSIAHLSSIIHRSRYVSSSPQSYNIPSQPAPFQASASRNSNNSIDSFRDAADIPEAAAHIAPTAVDTSSVALAVVPTPPSSAVNSTGLPDASD